MATSKPSPDLVRIREFVERFAVRKSHGRGEHLLGVGAVNCQTQQRIARAPFMVPSLVLVLAGRKTVGRGRDALCCEPGGYLTISACSELDVVNVPEPSCGRYLALYLHFDRALVDRYRRIYPRQVGSVAVAPRSFRVQGGPLLDATVWHLLKACREPAIPAEIRLHRLMEVLLCAVQHAGAEHLLVSSGHQWRERVSSLLLADPSRTWAISEVGRRLGVSESTLRRNLRREATTYRSLVEDVRMATALYEVQCTSLAITTIAGNCGYSSSSKFTRCFERRFGMPPSRMRLQRA